MAWVLSGGGLDLGWGDWSIAEADLSRVELALGGGILELVLGRGILELESGIDELVLEPVSGGGGNPSHLFSPENLP